MKKLILVLAITFAVNFAYAQWTTGTGNVTNTNTGYIGISTGLYVSGGNYQYALPNGAFLVGQHPQIGVYIPAPDANSGHQHYIYIDQPNTRLFLSNGNSDQGGGVQRPGDNTGETRFYSMPNYNGSSPAHMTFFNNNVEVMRLLNGNLGIGTSSPTQPLSFNIASSGKGISLGSYNSLSAGGFTFVGITGADGTFNGGNLAANDNGSAGMAIVHTSGGAGNSSELAFVTHNNGVDSRERLRIDRWGNVGIGIASPQAALHISTGGSNLDGGNGVAVVGGGALIQGNTGGRLATKGAQIEFAIPADANGGNIYGQARIATVAANANNQDATGKMILGTRRYFNKLGVGNQWYYGNDLTIDGQGFIGIGTTTPDAELAVNGTIHSKKVKIDLTNLPDYVFKPTYSLRPLSEVKAYIDQNQHLPEVPSAKSVEKDGMDVGEMNKLLLKKVEELTLYLIEQNKKIENLQKQINNLADINKN